MTVAHRRLAFLALPLLFLLGRPALAADDAWVEPKFDPPIGSKWTLRREVNVEKNTAGTMVGHTLKETALITVEDKTADGYVMTYERQGSTYEGDPAGGAVQRIAYAAEKGVVMRVVTDGTGKPLRVTNFAATKAALDAAIKVLPTGTANAEAVAAIRKIAERMVGLSDKQAAELYLNEWPLMALGQNTGLRPGDARTVTLPVANPLVPGMTKVLTLSIAKADPAAGQVRYLITETFDPESMKTLIGETFRELASSDLRAGGLDQVLKRATVVAVARGQLDVAGGVAHELRRQSVTSFRAPGAYSVTTEDELVTISPAGE